MKLQDYKVSQKIIHWLMALLIVGDLIVAQKFGGEMTVADRVESRSDHAQIGVIVTLLLIMRLYLRVKHGSPALPTSMPVWQQSLAHITQWGLYVLIGCLVVTGMLSAANANSVVAPFDLFAFGDGSGLEATFLTVRSIHEFTTNAIIALIGLHILGALYHGLFVKDGIMSKMLIFWRSE